MCLQRSSSKVTGMDMYVPAAIDVDVDQQLQRHEEAPAV
jgi:hypothetical protein